LANECALVIGTTGQSEAFIKQLESDCKTKGVGAVVAPNFAIGAIVMIHLARIASRFFDYAEITEMHQEKKIDAPRALPTRPPSRWWRRVPNLPPHDGEGHAPGARGSEYGGVAIHSQRMPGFVAHHEITFGGIGQSLRIRHDSNGRESFIPGVLLAVREVVNRKELVYGLDKLVGL
jgi:4-hydroxy-tetrahydrodipicolinate reductase